MKILYLAPVFKPAIGGGVIYLDLLSKCFISEEVCRSFDILTESYPGQPQQESSKGGRLSVFRKYPFRAGRTDKGFFSYFRYVWQNVLFFALPIFIYQRGINVLMVHGSFLNNPTTLWLVLKVVRFVFPKIKIVADLRDPKLPMRKISSLTIFDLVISCSENITQRLAICPEALNKTSEIPIIIDIKIPDEEVIRKIKQRYKLEGVEYVFNGSGIIRGKGVEHLFDLVSTIRRKGKKVLLVVAGKRRYWDVRFEQAIQEGWFYYLGQLTHEEVLAVTAGSWLDVNLSVVDSMPRHSLEALQVGAKVLLPGGVPEFDRACPDNTCVDSSISSLADKAIKIASCKEMFCDYKIEAHMPSNVIKQYAVALSNI